MRKLVILILLFFLTIEAFPQSNLPPYFPLTTDTLTQIVDHQYIQVVADRKNAFNIEEVMSTRMDTQFKYPNELIPTDSGISNTYWIRFLLKNETDNILYIGLISGAGKANFYLVDSVGGIAHYKTGYEYSFEERNGFKRTSSCPVELQPRTITTIYYSRYDYRVQEDFLNELEVTLLSTLKSLTDELNHYEERYYSGYYFLNGSVFGLLILAACFNLFFFITVKERVFLYFSLFLFAFSTASDFFLDVLLSGNSAMISFMDTFIYVFVIFLAQFVRHYFKTYQSHPKWDKVIKLSLIPNIIQIILVLFSVELPIIWEMIAEVAPVTLCIILLVITMFLMIRKSKQEIRFFFLLLAPFLFCFLGFIAIAIGGAISEDVDGIFGKLSIWVEDWADTIISGTICWAGIVFSWTLFNRHSRQRKEIAMHLLEKERLAKEKEIERAQFIAQQKVQLEKEVVERTAELKQSIHELKATQSQLIQSEKMASLGELTAGIAHEIQNPLNFVNNFSEVSNELMSEMNAELDKGDIEEAKIIANDIKGNLEKINHHGKRADGIVKGMLQHSRTSTGQKELTDINALCDEYLRLAYHGLRAKDKSFNAKFETMLSEGLPKIKVVPQDMGRVILNLINNAFYAVNDKQKSAPAEYTPRVIVKTTLSANTLQISVSDNGNGIPDKIKDKIFQPFFTTKPTGQGTGLGLSLSYDIVKAHGGELKVETTEGNGSLFLIFLPIRTD